MVCIRANFFCPIGKDVQYEVLGWLVRFEDSLLEVCFARTDGAAAETEAAVEAAGCWSHVDEEEQVEK